MSCWSSRAGIFPRSMRWRESSVISVRTTQGKHVCIVGDPAYAPHLRDAFQGEFSFSHGIGDGNRLLLRIGRMRFSPLLLTILVARILACAAVGQSDFFLRDGDKVAFLGDSITAARGYTKIVEHYTLMRFPERRVEFVNAGQGGDTASGSLKRLERDVFSQGATVMILTFGINDIGWGTKADDAHKQLYLDGVRSAIEQCRARGVRPVVCSAPITAEAPATAETGYLQILGDAGLALAKSLGVKTIDMQRGMREIQHRVEESNTREKDPAKQTRLHHPDGIHLNDLGQLAMAYVMLKGLDAPAEISSATLDAATSSQIEAKGCSLKDIKHLTDGIAFTRLDEGLPLNLGPLSGLQYGWIPVPDGLNGYRLTIRNLPPGEYSMQAGGRDLGQTTAAELAKGLNIAGATGNGWEPGGPWDAQSNVVKALVDSRDQLWMSGKLQRELLPEHPDQARLLESVRTLDRQLVATQRKVAKPFPYAFEIRRLAGQ